MGNRDDAAGFVAGDRRLVEWMAGAGLGCVRRVRALDSFKGSQGASVGGGDWIHMECMAGTSDVELDAAAERLMYLFKVSAHRFWRWTCTLEGEADPFGGDGMVLVLFQRG